MLKNLALFLGFCSGLATTAHARVWVTPDFFIDQVNSRGGLLELAHETDCRAHISKVMCLVEPAPANADPATKPRVCQPGGESYAHYFEELYDNYPPLMQKMFCSLNVIFVEKDFDGTAYAGLSKDPKGVVNGAVMGIRKSVLDEGLDLATWATWKEQLSFGGDPASYRNPSRDLPLVQTASRPGVSSFLYFAVSHEFGHIFDFANRLNRVTSRCTPTHDAEDPECEMAPESWGALSWRTSHTPLATQDFSLRAGLCFYWCKDHALKREQVAEAYAGLDASNFISMYAATEPWDDFADSLGYYLFAKNLEGRYQIDARTGASYDIIAKLHSARFATKYRFIERFLARTDIEYP